MTVAGLSSSTVPVQPRFPIGSAAHKIYMLTKLRPIINNTQAMCLYKSKILPYFDYGDIFYNKTFTRNTLKLQKLQNRALKLCLKREPRYDTELLHTEAKLPRLQARRMSHIWNFAFQRTKDPQYLVQFERGLRYRAAPILHEPFSRCETFRRSVLYQCAVGWNALPVDERNIEDYSSFKLLQKQKIAPN